jgi:protein-S-isoprenylcysteine O-methyltransferase Ste14
MEQKRKIIPPVYFFAALLMMWALHRWWPGMIFLTAPKSYIGIAWIVFGVAINLWSARAFTKVGTPLIPFERSTALVISGLYRHTRNPMYLGMVLILVGVWLLLGSLTAGLPILAFVCVIEFNFIRGEERFLEEIFGQKYLDYKTRVRRWV